MKSVFLRANARIILAVVAMVFLVFLVGLSRLKFDYRFETFFPKNDPGLQAYEQFVKTFGSDNDFFIIALEHEQGIFNQEFLFTVDSLTTAIESLAHISQVNSPTKISYPIKSPFGYTQVKYIHLNQPELYPKDSFRIFNTPNLVGGLFSTNGKAVSLVVKHESGLTKAQNDSLYLSVKATVERISPFPHRIVGKVKGQYYFIGKMRNELALFVGLSVALLILFLYFTFKNFWGIWVPLTIVGLSVTYLLGIMGFAGKQINIMTTIIPTILFVVGISNVVHILEKYIEELRKGKLKIDALTTAFKEIGLATALTSTTTALGFLSLSTSNILPVKEFGMYTALGVLIAFVLAFTVLPSILTLSGVPAIAKKEIHMLFWTKYLHRLFSYILPNAKKIFAWACVVILAATAGLWMIKTDNKFIDDWLVSEEARNDYRYFENQFSGFRPFEVMIYHKDTGKSLMTFENALALETFETELKETFGSSFVLSPLTFIKAANQAMNGGAISAYRLPDNEAEWNKIEREQKRFKVKQLDDYLTANQNSARFSMKVVDYGGHRMLQLVDSFELKMQTFNANYPHLGYELTGMPLLIDKNNRYLASNVVSGLVLAFLLIGVIMGLLFKSWRMVFISLLPNVVPLIFIVFIMGVFGIYLNISTSVIFTIAFGIAVDDTIHFMSKFRLELSKGKSMLYALKRTYISTGKAILITTLILCSGFNILMFSAVSSTFYIGLLISMTLFFAVVSDMILLPVLILLFYKHKPRKELDL